MKLGELLEKVEFQCNYRVVYFDFDKKERVEVEPRAFSVAPKGKRRANE